MGKVVAVMAEPGKVPRVVIPMILVLVMNGENTDVIKKASCT